MKESYLGIVHEAGLVMLVPETEHAGPFLMRRAERQNALCFWAVIETSSYDAIRLALDRGDLDVALLLLQLYADDCGSILMGTYSIEKCQLTRHDRLPTPC